MGVFDLEVFLRNAGNMLEIRVWGTEKKFKLELYIRNEHSYNVSDH